MARPKKDGTHVNLYLDREIMEKVEATAKEEGITKTFLIEMALSEWIKKQQRKKSKDTVGKQSSQQSPKRRSKSRES